LASVGGGAFLAAGGTSLADAAGTGGREGFAAFGNTFPKVEPPAAVPLSREFERPAAGELAGVFSDFQPPVGETAFGFSAGAAFAAAAGDARSGWRTLSADAAD
jgi:hypothetical protein